jgi:hypothetical protein
MLLIGQARRFLIPHCQPHGSLKGNSCNLLRQHLDGQRVSWRHFGGACRKDDVTVELRPNRRYPLAQRVPRHLGHSPQLWPIQVGVRGYNDKGRVRA